MKTVLNIYRQFQNLPKELTDRDVASHLLVLTVFFFTLGFTISQIIIFIIDK